MGKRFKNGLVLGKFFPFHLGHKYLIDSALKQCNKVHVIVCGTENEETSAAPSMDRYLMVQNTYKNNNKVRVIYSFNNNPQYPSECNSTDEFYYKYWNPVVNNNITELDAVFTSEDYGEEFAHYLGVQHVLVDKGRKAVPVSGTAVRSNIMANWRKLPKATQMFFKKKVVVVGPESCGKSTIVNKLAIEFNSKHKLKEYGRTYVETIPTEILNGEDFNIIAKNHNRLIDYHYSRFKYEMFLFIDTEAIVTKTFKKMYLPDSTSSDNELDYIIGIQKFDLILLLTPEVKWVDDGTRDFSDKREEHFQLIKAELEKNNKPYVLISGEDYEDRYKQAKEAVEKLNKV